jgi:hypothetical protein
MQRLPSVSRCFKRYFFEAKLQKKEMQRLPSVSRFLLRYYFEAKFQNIEMKRLLSSAALLWYFIEAYASIKGDERLLSVSRSFVVLY